MAEQRYQAVLAVISDGLSISQVAEKVGVSRQTLHSWLARYEAEGLEGPVDRSHRPVRCPHQMPADVGARLLELRRSRPYWGLQGTRSRVVEYARRHAKYLAILTKPWRLLMAKLGEHAVILGASMAGLVAARALAEFFETVTVVERDSLGDGTDHRRGVPQGRQIHALILRGAQALEELFPGILDELVAAGAPSMDYRDLSKLHFNMGGHLCVQSGSLDGMSAYSPSRPFLESHVRRRVRAIPNIAFRDNHDAVEVTSNTSCDRIIGARVVSRHSRAESELSANLVVDATGRGARTPAMLERLGYPRPREDQVAIDLMYASQLLRMPPGAMHESGAIVAPVPGRPTGMAIVRYEHDTVMFAVFGMAGNDPPVECTAMCDYAEDFAPAHLLAAVRAAEPLEEAVQHRFPASRWRRYDKMRQLPDGLLVVGDAVCSFNPIYGQGMTVAALEALALRNCLSRGTKDLPRRFFRAASKPIGQAWQLAVGGDLSLPEIAGSPPLSTRLLNGYVDRLLTAAENDTAPYEQFLRVAWLVDPPIRLLRPSMMWRAASANPRRQKRATPAPHQSLSHDRTWSRRCHDGV